jgi:hypothetical protein
MATKIGNLGITFGDSTTQNSHAIISITAGTGLTGGTITHPSGTIAVDIYTGSDASNLSFPIGSYLAVFISNTTAIDRNATGTIRLEGGTVEFTVTGTGSIISGTWRARGVSGTNRYIDNKQQRIDRYHLFQRTA